MGRIRQCGERGYDVRAPAYQFRLDIRGREPAAHEEGVGEVDSRQVRDRVKIQP
jgi:hypothetical protein